MYRTYKVLKEFVFLNGSIEQPGDRLNFDEGSYNYNKKFLDSLVSNGFLEPIEEKPKTVWDKELKRFVCYDDIYNDCYTPSETCFGICDLAVLFNRSHDIWDNFIISQDTGIKDKNGESIYTGDIVEKRYSIDEEFNGVRGICFYDAESAEVDFKLAHGSDHIKGFLEEYEVVGNIWQNLGLLEEK